MIRLKRVYELPKADDGLRYLVDRLWPRGISKDKLEITAWMKELAPSTELRRWFHGKSGEWNEFEKRYLAELSALDPQIWRPLAIAARKGRVTLLYAAKDPKKNHSILLKEFLSSKGVK